MGNRLVEKHRLPPDALRPNNLVPVQRWLDALAEIQSVIGNEVVRGVGAAIIENADSPPVQLGRVSCSPSTTFII